VRHALADIERARLSGERLAVRTPAKKTRFRLLTRRGIFGFPLGMRLSKAGKWLPASFQPSKAIAPRMRKSTLFAYTDSTGTESPNWPVVAR